MADQKVELGVRKYVKLPVEVEAVQSTGLNYRELAEWCGGTYHFWLEAPKVDPITREESEPIRHVVIRFRTVQNETVTADEGDWIVRGPHGDFWPVKDHIFTSSYAQKKEP